ncbi:MAG TPA: ribosome biogenesis GTPase Der [Firmicutes bacterium]|nr:ribosome biogenesis GTPase Der [Bacillota bacterium]
MSRTVIAIVGRPNVGKSTLFNRIARQRLAIVEDTPGVTRDRLYANGEWLGRQFLLIDTGGLTDARDTIQTQIRTQVAMALEEADAIIMVVDGRESLTSSDHQVATLLRKTNKPVVVAINKIDNFSEYTDPEVYQLGLDEPVSVSAEHGKNIGDLLDLVLSKIPEGINDIDLESVRVTFVGRPNVGKSSLVNALLGQSRVIVSAEPGTTRDAIDTPLIVGDKHYLLVDTAGIRRKSKVEESVEYYSVLRALKAVERSDVVILVLDATALATSGGVADQELKIAGIIRDAGKACFILVNKWDAVEKDVDSTAAVTEKIRSDIDFLNYAPIIFVSAKSGQRLSKILPTVDQVMESYTFRIATNRLNAIISEAIALHSPPSRKGRLFKIYFSNQVGVKPPKFLFTVNDAEGMHFSYRRYLENKIREYFAFSGTPIQFDIAVKHKKQE